jgi:hypothetical protein
MDPKERRRHVRMRPLPELPAHGALSQGVIWEKLAVHDVSIGGVAFVTSDPLRGYKPGDPITLRLSLARYGEHGVTAQVRYVSDSVTGVEFTNLSPDATSAVRKYVAELLERGAMS